MGDWNPIHADVTVMQMQTSNSQRTLSEARSAAGHGTGTDADLKKASQAFESLLLTFMIREMRATVPESDLFPKSMAEEIFSSMRDEQIAEEMSRSGGIGISRMVFNQLNGEE
jgi:flagellar protein FlgJ